MSEGSQVVFVSQGRLFDYFDTALFSLLSLQMTEVEPTTLSVFLRQL
jgi:hypothetical protein